MSSNGKGSSAAAAGNHADGGSKGGQAAPAARYKKKVDPNNNKKASRPGRRREMPVSKFDDLIMHGVKPYDSDADEFYEALVEARIELDKELDAMDAEDAR